MSSIARAAIRLISTALVTLFLKPSVLLLMILFAQFASAEEKRLDWGVAQTVQDLNLYLKTASWASDQTADLMEPLFLQDDNGNLIPAQAQSWSISEDNRTLRFKLRDNLKWSDGSPIVAEDYVRGTQLSLYYYKKNSWSGSVALDNLVGAAEFLSDETSEFSGIGAYAEDDKTIVYQFNQPITNHLNTIMTEHTNDGFWPAHPSLGEQPWIDEWNDPAAVFTNGPYKVESFEPGERITLTKNEYHYDQDNIYFDTINYRSIEHTHDVLVKSILSSELSIVRAFEARSIKWLVENRPDFVNFTSGNNITYIVFNTNRPPLDNVECRRALIQAIDRDFIVNSVAAEFGIAIERWVPSHFKLNESGYDSNKAWPQFNIEAASDGIRQYCSTEDLDEPALELAVRDQDSDKALANAITAMWSGAGVKSDVVARPSSEHYNVAMLPGEFDIGLAGWHGYGEGVAYFFRMLHTDTLPPAGNYGAAGSPALDDLINEAEYSLDREKIRNLLHEAEDLVIDGAWTFPLLQGQVFVVKHPGITWRNTDFSRSWGSRWLRFSAETASAETASAD